MPWGALLAGTASIVGGAISAGGAESAASTSAAAANAAAQVQQNMFNTTQQNLQPWISGGGNALAQLQRALGIAPAASATPGTAAPGTTQTPGTAAPGATGGIPTPNGPFNLPQPGQQQQFANGFSIIGNQDGSYAISGPGLGAPVTYPAGSDPNTIFTSLQNLGVGMPTGSGGTTTPQPVSPAGTQQQPAAAPAPAAPGSASPYAGFQSSPGYQFQLSQGLQAIQNQNAAQGGQNSGNTLKALQTYGTGLANQDWYNYLNQLTGLSNTGENAAANLGNTGVSAGANIGNSIMAAGNASAAGTLGATSAVTQGLTGAVQNYFQQSYLNNNNGLNTNYLGGPSSALNNVGSTAGQAWAGTA